MRKVNLMLNSIKWLAINLLALSLFIIASLLCIVYYLVFYGIYDPFFKGFSVAIDKFGNVTMPNMWDFLFVKKGGYLFGNENETISSVLGKNLVLKKLTIFGYIIVFILTKKHCMNAIDNTL
jgi:hypothetical protein